MSSKNILVKKINTLTGHKDCIYTLEKNAQDKIFYSAGGDGIVAKWNLEQPEIGDLIIKVPNSVYALHYLQEKNFLIVGQNFEGLHLIDLEHKKEVASVKITAEAIFDIKVYENNIFVACGDGVLIVVDLESLTVRKHLKASDKSARTIAINPKKQEFAIGYSDNTIKIFDLEKLDFKQSIKAHKNSVFTLCYSPNCNFLLSGSRDAHLKVWQVEDNYSLKEDIVAHMYAINHITFRPCGQYFATCSMDKSIKIWHTKTWKLLKVLDKARHAGHATSVNKLLWSSYKHQLLSGSDDRSVSVWEINFEAKTRTL